MQVANDDTISDEMHPTLQLAWRPHCAGITKNVLISVSNRGYLCHWHTTSGKMLHCLQEPDNYIMSADYNASGTRFVTAGTDKYVRVYDE